MYSVYILESLTKGRWYVGSTEDVVARLTWHNAGKVRSSRPFLPYRIVYTESFSTRAEAMSREKQIKRSGIIRKAIRSRIKKHGPVV